MAAPAAPPASAALPAPRMWSFFRWPVMDGSRGGRRAARARSATVAVGVARHPALDVVPAVAHRIAGFRPLQARTRTARIPVALELRLDVVEALAAIPAVGVVTVLVGRLVVAPVAPARVVRHVAVVGLEVVVVLGRVHGLGDRVAGLGADHAADHRADDGADRPGHRADRRTRDATGHRAGALANAVVLLDIGHFCALLVWGASHRAGAVIVATMRYANGEAGACSALAHGKHSSADNRRAGTIVGPLRPRIPAWTRVHARPRSSASSVPSGSRWWTASRRPLRRCSPTPR